MKKQHESNVQLNNSKILKMNLLPLDSFHTFLIPQDMFYVRPCELQKQEVQ